MRTSLLATFAVLAFVTLCATASQPAMQPATAPNGINSAPASVINFHPVGARRPGPTTRPTIGPGSAAGDSTNQSRIVAVEGLVQFRPDDATPWSKAVAGIDLPDGAELRIGPRSAIRLSSDDKEITIDRMGIQKIDRELYQTGKRKIGMPYGRTRYDIEEAGVEHTSEIVTPSSILVIRGCPLVFIRPDTATTHPTSAPATRPTNPQPPANHNRTR